MMVPLLDRGSRSTTSSKRTNKKVTMSAFLTSFHRQRPRSSCLHQTLTLILPHDRAPQRDEMVSGRGGELTTCSRCALPGYNVSNTKLQQGSIDMTLPSEAWMARCLIWRSGVGSWLVAAGLRRSGCRSYLRFRLWARIVHGCGSMGVGRWRRVLVGDSGRDQCTSPFTSRK